VDSVERTSVTDPAGLSPPRLIQLVARFRPDADGVGETALRVADVLRKDYGIASDFLVYNPPRADCVLEIPGEFPHTVENLGGGAAAALNAALDRFLASPPSPVLLLHYSSYGFSGHGTPLWLPGALERFTARGGRLITLFHELYALPRFPSRTFFTSWLQRRIFRRTLAASQAAFTSNEDFVAVAGRDNGRNRPIGLIGICSSAGEPEQPPPLRGRTRRIAVFGRFATRRRLYALHLGQLQRLAEHLGVEEIADMGAVEDEAWMRENVARPLGPLLRAYGALSVPEASRIFEDSIAGTLAYSSHLLGKSSVAAAYQAHAAAIVLFPEEWQTRPQQTGGWILSAEDLLALPARSDALFDRLQKAASEAHTHYNTSRSARCMAQTLLPALGLPANAPGRTAGEAR